jgi:hypothetical protein
MQCHIQEYLDFQKREPYLGVFDDYYGIYNALLPKYKMICWALNLKELWSLKISGTTIPTVQCHIPEYLDFQRKEPYSRVFDDYHGIYNALLPKYKMVCWTLSMKELWCLKISVTTIQQRSVRSQNTWIFREENLTQVHLMIIMEYTLYSCQNVR